MINYDQFVEKLITDTTNHHIKWENLFDLTDAEDNLGTLSDLIFITEFHDVTLFSSFYGSIEGLSIAVIEERIESGKSGLISEGVNLYVSADLKTPFTPILANKDLILLLQDIISKQIDLFKSPINTKIEDYLNKEY